MELISLFPLNIVVYPEEKLNLHIFEPRYRALISEALQQDRLFGIPSYVLNKIEYGTTVYIEKVVKTYADGRMDIITRGKKIFKVIRFENPAPQKLYAEGEVAFLPINFDSNASIDYIFKEKVNELANLLSISSYFDWNAINGAYDVAHQIGLSKEKEYELLQIKGEVERKGYIIEHIERIIPVLKETENAKKRVKMNGHFRNFGPLDF